MPRKNPPKNKIMCLSVLRRLSSILSMIAAAPWLPRWGSCREATEGVPLVRSTILTERRTLPPAFGHLPQRGRRGPGLGITETLTASRRGRRPRLPGYSVRIRPSLVITVPATDSPNPGYHVGCIPPGGPGGPPLRPGRTACLSPGPRHNRNARRLS